MTFFFKTDTGIDWKVEAKCFNDALLWMEKNWTL